MSSSSESFVCDSCGAKHVVYRHSFNKGYARALWKAKIYGKEIFSVGEIKMSNAEYANFPRLKHWGLTEQVVIDGDRKAGFHRITDFGNKFLSGKISIPRFVFVRSKEVVETSQEQILFREVADGYEYSEDYKDQVRAQL